MGCDIHIIVQCRKNGVWNFVEEVPESLDCRNYSTFAFLADIRNNFDTKGFSPKGLPDDLNGFRYRFRSEKEDIVKRYNENTTRKVLLPDGTYIDVRDDSIEKIVNTEEEARSYEYYSIHNEKGNKICYVYDASLRDGKIVDVPYKDLMSFEDFLKGYDDEWDEEAQDYGYWRVDFECCDYHSHSWLTLDELKKFDKTDYLTDKVRISSYFYDNFVKMGGVLPEGMTVEDHRPTDIVDALRYAYCPEVTVKFLSKENHDDTPVMKGICELEKIAEKYGVSDEDIRIVFAFDN